MSTKNGSNAGKAPFAKSVAKWPLESAAIARLSRSARKAGRLATDYATLGVACAGR